MCIALATIGKNKPSLDILHACEEANPHGGGIAWRKGKRIHWKKGINADEIHKIVQRESGPFLIHFRIATVGGVSPELCHPFPVGGKASLAVEGSASAVVAHNGTWHNWKRTIEGAAHALKADLPVGVISDSRAMAWLVAHVGVTAFNSDDCSRFAHFTAARGIKLFGHWHKMSGFYASNLNWRSRLERDERPWRSSLYDDVTFELESAELEGGE
jgi:predicted glutamine amidotransferase